MNLRTILTVVLLLPLAAQAGTSAHYSLAPITIDSGGGLGTSASYSHESSLEALAAGASASPESAGRHGFVTGPLAGPPAEYVTWAQGLDDADGFYYADPNDDGIPNGLAFFLGATDAATDGNAKLPVVEVIDNAGTETLELEFRRLDAAAALDYRVLFSFDLITWQVAVDGIAGMAIVEIDDGLGVGVDKIVATIPTGGAPRMFAGITVLPLPGQVLGFPVLPPASHPVGYVRQPLAASGDSLFGPPMQRRAHWAGSLTGVSGDVVSVPPVLVNDFTISGNDRYYLLVSSGTLAGRLFEVLGNTASTITLDPDGPVEVAALGLQSGDRARLIPHWTLATLFAYADGLPVTGVDVLNPASTVRLYDLAGTGINQAPQTTVFYHDGSVLPQGAGWYDNDDLGAGLQDHLIIRPATYLVVRNTTAAATEMLMAGEVPIQSLGTGVKRFAALNQDNLVINPYPVPLTLGTSGLVTSGVVETITGLDVLSPADTVKFFLPSAGYNLAPGKTYFYHDGSSLPDGPGWYDNDALGAGLQDSVELAPGAPLIIRRGSGTPGTTLWIPLLPYSLR